MSKKLIIGGGIAGVMAVIGGIGFFLMSGGTPETLNDQPLAVEEVEVEREPILSLTRPDRDPFNVYGPVCYQDGRGNDTLIASTPESQTDCFTFRNGGNDLIDLSGKTENEPVLIAINSSSPARQTVRLGPADDYIEFQGDFDATIDGAPGQDTVLSLPQVTTVDLRFRQSGGNVILMTPRGEITLVNQAVGSGLDGVISHILLRHGQVLGRSQIRVQSVVGQGTPGSDMIRSTTNDDIIYPGLGDDVITLLGGENRVHYEGGNDTITSSGDEGAYNSLFIEYPRAEVDIDVVNQGRDVVFVTQDGTVTLSLQLFYPVGDPRVPIQEIVFVDGPVTDEEIRFLIEIEEQESNRGSVDDRMRIRQ